MLRDKIITKLKQRKEAMGISYEVIAKRSNIGLATVKRVFKGDDVSIGKIEKIIDVLELDDDFKPRMSTAQIHKREINRKAEAILARVIHTSSLEAQKPSDKAIKLLYKDTYKAISGLPHSKVWL